MSLQQLTTLPAEITPEKLGVDALKNQFGEIARLSFPKLEGLPVSGDVRLPDLQMLTGLVGGFEQVAHSFDAGPEALIAELRGLLGDMRSNSGALGGPFDALLALTGNLDALPERLHEAFGSFDSTIVPLIGRFQDQPVDAGAVVEMLQLHTLAETLEQQFTAPLQAAHAPIEHIISQVAPLGNPDDLSWLAGYDRLLQQVADGELTVLDDAAAVDDVQAMVGTLNGQLRTTADRLGQFGTGLNDLSADMSAALARLDPQRLVPLPPIFEQALQQLEQLQVGKFITPVEQAVATVDALLGQQIDQVINLIDQGVTFIVEGIGQARQLLVKIQAIATNLIDQVTGFVTGLDIPGIIQQGKQAFSSFADTIDALLVQLNDAIAPVFTFIDQLIDQLGALDFRPFIQQLHTVLYRVVGVLDDPQIRQVTDQVKAGVDQVMQYLDQIGFNLIVDQVVTQADQMQATLAAIDLSQLNTLLRQALRAALDLVRDQIDPPDAITEPILQQFDQNVMQPVTTVLEPIQAEITSILDAIHAVEPGTLVSQQLTPLYDELAGTVRAWLDREQILQQLSGVTAFYDDILEKIDTHANPETLLQPLVEAYGTVQEFIAKLNPDTLLEPVEKLLDIVRNQVASLDLTGSIELIRDRVTSVTQKISNFRLQEQSFWAPIRQVLDIQPQKLLDDLMQQMREAINRLDLSALEPVMSGLQRVQTAVLNATGQNALPSVIEQVLATIEAGQRQVLHQITRLNALWESASSQNLSDTQRERLRALNPFTLLGTVTSLLDRMLQAGRSLLAAFQPAWQTLQRQLARGGAFLDRLLSEGAGALKELLRQLLDTLVAGPLARIVSLLNEPLDAVRRAVDAVLKLQEHLGVFDTLSEIIDRIGQSVVALQNDITGFNLEFLRKSLGKLINTATQPLGELNPQFLIDELAAIYQRILGMLQTFHPERIIDAARGTLTLQRGAATDALTIPPGTQFTATTPVGAVSFRSIASGHLPAGTTQIDLLVQADSPGAAGNIIVSSAQSDEVSWQVDGDGLPELAGLTPANPEPILSLLTRVQQIVFAQLDALHPDTLLAQPLNAVYAQVIARLDELGLERLLAALFERFQQLDQELKEEMDRVGAALGSMLAAAPV